jgi:hypothetical protein
MNQLQDAEFRVNLSSGVTRDCGLRVPLGIGVGDGSAQRARQRRTAGMATGAACEQRIVPVAVLTVLRHVSPEHLPYRSTFKAGQIRSVYWLLGAGC